MPTRSKRLGARWTDPLSSPGSHMFVGIMQVDLTFPEATDLKGKRRVVRGLKERLRRQFHVDAAEVGILDNCREACLGITLVSNEVAHVQKRCQAVLEFIERQPAVAIEDTQVEIL